MSLLLPKWLSSMTMVHSAELSEDEGLLWFRDKIYVPQNLDLWRRVVSLYYNTKVTGYPRHWKTLELVSRDYWWPQMSRYIGQYVSTCDLCIRTKLIRQAPVGELHPLQIPDLWWDILSVNFVMELPLFLSAAKVRWPELSQLSLCSAFDKENSIEFPLDFLSYLYTFLTLTLY